jgi:RNase H-like domain found in reverse transcriptase/Reverse transcriptase (RNA-dependent DNA polymerase)
VTDVDYEVNINNKNRIFHVNCTMINNTEDCDDNEIHTVSSGQESYRDVKLGHMPDDIKTRISQLLLDFCDVLSAIPGKTTAIEHEINLTSERPIKLQPYNIPLHYREQVQAKIKDLLKSGISEPSDSSYAAPIVLVKKKNDEVRLCVEYRQLNKVTILDADSVPNQEELFIKIAQAKYFSKFDLSKGYWQIPIKESSKKFTAFVTPFGLYHWNFMSFGLINAPATFNRLMRRVLASNNDTVAYLDDICLFSKNWDEHITGLQALFTALKNNGLTARPSKVEIGMTEIQFLGHMISYQTVKPVGETLKHILDIKIPKSLKEVRSLIGLCNYYRKFIPNFASLVHPITELTRKKGRYKGIEWTKECDDTLHSIKTLFAEQPILRLPDLGRPFLLATDASAFGIGACLMQEVDTHLHPVVYVSRKLSESEKNYATIEKECLAIVWAVTKLSKYLSGTRFTLLTDKSTLVALENKKLHNARLTRWALILQDYRFDIVHIPGAQNVIADALSRN